MLKHKKIATLNCAHLRLLSFFLYLISIHILLVVHTFLSPDFNSAPLLLLLILVARTSLSPYFVSAPFFILCTVVVRTSLSLDFISAPFFR